MTRRNRPSAAELAELRILARAAAVIIRRERGITQAELARAYGCHQQSISLIEKGRPNAPLRVLRRLIVDAGIGRERHDAPTPQQGATAP